MHLLSRRSGSGVPGPGRSGKGLRDMHGQVRPLEDQPCFEGADRSTMPELEKWMVESDRVLTFQGLSVSW